jgi:O-antigen ligase
MVPSVWTGLPGREPVQRAFQALELAYPWMPLSLDPEGTIGSLLSVLPVLAILFLLSSSEAARKSLWPVLIVAIALVQLVLGVTQIAGGRNSPLYFYDFTNRGATVGFFSNSNHHATLLLMALPFAAVLGSRLLRGPGQLHDKLAKVILLASIFGLLAAGVLLNGSRAGLLLLPLVLVLSACMMAADFSRRSPRLWFGVAALAIAGAAIAASATGFVNQEQLGASGRGERTSRSAIWANTAPLVAEHFPYGSGLGSFAILYRTAEDPLDRPSTYANHAHNDWLEWILETGIIGLGFAIAFLAWFGTRSWRAWSHVEGSLSRAASVAMVVPLVHSIVDYPLRTAAIAALFALCGALLFHGTRRHRQGSAPASY